MNITRRKIFKRVGTGSAIAAMCVAGLIRPIQAVAGEWNKVAFETKSENDALKSIGADAATENKDMLLNAPPIAENGSVVPISVVSNIPKSTSISFFVDKNPLPLACSFEFSNGALPEVAVRLKFIGTSKVRAIVMADGKAYTSNRDVKVTAGGCGG